MPDAFAYDVFISYSHIDSAWVHGKLLPRLEAAGLRVCIDDRDFRLGAPSVTEMERAVRASRQTLLVLTPAYLGSDWTAFENLMLQTDDPLNRRLTLIPLLKETCDIPARLGIFTYADFTKGEDWQRLLAALGAPGHKDQSTPTRADWDLVHPYGMPPNFTGRFAERKMLTDWLDGNGPALFVLRALGGFGKSALVWHWLLYDVDPARWPRVVWWCFYEPAAPFDRFLARTLEYLGVDPKPLGPREQVEEILRALYQPGTLLVLDGFERELRAFAGMGAAYQGDQEGTTQDGHDRDCVSPLAEVFLRGVCSLPDLKGRVVLTTRLRPRILETRSGELLSGCGERELLALQPEDAVDFFHAEGIRGTRAEIMASCDPYGYHPLSLRFLAGLVLRDLQKPGDIAAAQKLDISGDLVQRQHHVLEQAYENLAPWQRRLLSRIACFRGAVSYEAVTAAAGENPPEKVDDSLRDFVARGLLHHDARDRRFDLHPIVRRYAYDRLRKEERQDAHRTLRDYFAAVPPPERVQALADLDPVIELYHHMVRAGTYDAAFELYRDRISRATYYQLGAYELCIELLGSLFPDGEDLPPRLNVERNQGWILNELGNSYKRAGQPRRAMLLFKRQHTIYEALENKAGFVVGLTNLADDEMEIGELRSAEAHLHQQLGLCQESDDAFQEAIGHHHLGRLLVLRGRWEEAEVEFQRALAIFEENGDVQAQSVVWAYRCLLWLSRNHAGVKSKASQSLAAAQRSLELAEETTRTLHPYPRDYVRAYWLLGAAHRETGDLTAAERHLSEALTRCRRISAVDAETDILLDLARLRLKIGDLAEARRLAEEALTITERCGYVLQGADVHLLLAQLDIDESRPDAAREHAAEARRLATCDGPPDYTYKVAYDEAGALLERLGV